MTFNFSPEGTNVLKSVIIEIVAFAVIMSVLGLIYVKYFNGVMDTGTAFITIIATVTSMELFRNSVTVCE